MPTCPNGHPGAENQNFCTTCGAAFHGAAQFPKSPSTSSTTSPIRKGVGVGIATGCLTALLIVGGILVALFVIGYQMFRVQ